ncbi:serine/threonine-protein kinase 16 [Eurytemora carolleeae]|uniref:serine/threonine-protein kinase 16 n=1 Tax=Eurytemora carolleeae TaxID=1294199 RepID=UPI000C779A5A|nr:serine/threonine-protein kinase 16 [Eurytemora carolleeae]|eukprot:XP_023342481.1 serine/threonine-protein kinase 16-like [Eurytemora affinis]
MSSWIYLFLNYLKRMGCILLRPSLVVEGQKYKVRRQLAEGGFSTIDLAENTRNGKLVAIKRITCHSIQDQNLGKFEIEVHRKFQHENIIRLIGASIEGDADIIHNITSEIILVLPYYERGSLQDELEKRCLKENHLEETVLLRLFHCICSAVRRFHSHDPPYAHRDIKPHNILLEKDFTPILMDLGSVAPARITIRSNRDAQFLQDTAAERCSMTYRPPELFMVPSSFDITEKTDIWSLGCLLYSLMYFKSPFDSVYERGDSVALAVQSGDISFPTLKKPYSDPVQQLVRKMMNLDMSFRPSIDGVIEETENILSSEQSNQTVAVQIK